MPTHHRPADAVKSSQTSNKHVSPSPKIRERKPHSFETGESFVAVRGPFFMDPSLADEEKICLIGLESFAQKNSGCFPGNPTLARHCGWLLPSGKPNKRRVQKILERLEDKGRIRRDMSNRDGGLHRDNIELLGLRPQDQVEGTSESTRGTSIQTSPISESTRDHVETDMGVRPNQHGGTSESTPELEELEPDPGNQIHQSSSTEAAQPKQAALLCCAAEEGNSKWFTDDERQEFGKLVAYARRPYLNETVRHKCIVACSEWLVERFPTLGFAGKVTRVLENCWVKDRGRNDELAKQFVSWDIDLSRIPKHR